MDVDLNWKCHFLKLHLRGSNNNSRSAIQKIKSYSSNIFEHYLTLFFFDHHTQRFFMSTYIFLLNWYKPSWPKSSSRLSRYTYHKPRKYKWHLIKDEGIFRSSFLFYFNFVLQHNKCNKNCRAMAYI